MAVTNCSGYVGNFHLCIITELLLEVAVTNLTEEEDHCSGNDLSGQVCVLAILALLDKYDTSKLIFFFIRLGLSSVSIDYQRVVNIPSAPPD